MKWNATALGAILVAASLIGCGGGGGSAPPPVTAAPNLTINWAERSRVVNAPGSAQSARVTLDSADPLIVDLVWFINRGSNLAAFSQIYTAPSSVMVGNWTLSVELFAEPDGQGARVGQGTVPVVLTSTGAFQTSDGEPLTTISIQQTIASVALAAVTIQEGQSTELLASAFDSTSALVPVTPGSFRYSLTSGGTNATLSLAGLLTGVQTGAASATASVDGVTSPAAAVTVTPLPANYIRFFPYNLWDVEATADGNTVYASLRDQNRILKINVQTGAVLPFADLSYRPAEMALSSDGSVLYVGGDRTGELTKFNTSDGSVQWVIDYGVDPGQPNSRLYAIDVTVDPTDSNRWAIILASSLFSPSDVDVIVYEGQQVVARRGGGMGITHLFFNETGSEMVGFAGGNSSFSAGRIQIVGNGVEFVQEQWGVVSSGNVFPRRIGNRLAFVDGTIINMNDLSLWGRVPFPPGVGRGTAHVELDRGVTIDLGQTVTVRQIKLSTNTLLMTHTVDNMDGAERMLPFQNGGFAIWGGGKLILLRPAPMQ